jgi:hypothetical protein
MLVDSQVDLVFVETFFGRREMSQSAPFLALLCAACMLPTLHDHLFLCSISSARVTHSYTLKAINTKIRDLSTIYESDGTVEQYHPLALAP